MRWRRLLLALLLTASGLGCGVATRTAVVDLLVRDVTVVSPERPEALAGAWVAVSGERIVEVGQGEPPYRAAVEIDGRGRFLTPGLIDGHVHLASVPGLAGPADSASAELRPALAAYERQLPRSYLFFGFTTVVDLNVVDFAWLRRFAAQPLHPDLYHCGGALALANGYPMVFAPLEARFDLYPNFLWDERQAKDIPARFRPEDHTPEAAVGRVAGTGGRCVKAHWEDGFGPARIWPTPTRELVAKVVAAARSRGLPVLLHANSLAAHRFATDAGVDVIVHGLWNWDGHQAEGELPPAIGAVLDDEIARGIGLMPTTRVLAGLRDLFDPDFLADARFADAVPGELHAWYRTAEARSFVEELRGDVQAVSDEEMYRRFDRGVAAAQAVVSYFAARGGRLLFGSDTPSAPIYTNPPGLNGLLEIAHLGAAGVTPRQLLAAATLANAEAFRLERELGSVEAGKVANLLLLAGDPSRSLDAWSTIETVIFRGAPIARETLSARRRAGSTARAPRPPRRGRPRRR